MRLEPADRAPFFSAGAVCDSDWRTCAARRSTTTNAPINTAVLNARAPSVTAAITMVERFDMRCSLTRSRLKPAKGNARLAARVPLDGGRPVEELVNSDPRSFVELDLSVDDAKH